MPEIWRVLGFWLPHVWYFSTCDLGAYDEVSFFSPGLGDSEAKDCTGEGDFSLQLADLLLAFCPLVSQDQEIRAANGEVGGG